MNYISFMDMAGEQLDEVHPSLGVMCPDNQVHIWEIIYGNSGDTKVLLEKYN